MKYIIEMNQKVLLNYCVHLLSPYSILLGKKKLLSNGKIMIFKYFSNI